MPRASAPRPPETEHQHQVRLIAWAAANLETYPDLAWLAAVPNGGHRSPAVAGKLKAEGVRPGYPDLVLDVARGGYHGWRGELKARKRGAVSDAQAAWHDRLRAEGYAVDVAMGWEAMRDALLRYLALGAR